MHYNVSTYKSGGSFMKDHKKRAFLFFTISKTQERPPDNEIDDFMNEGLISISWLRALFARMTQHDDFVYVNELLESIFSPSSLEKESQEVQKTKVDHSQQTEDCVVSKKTDDVQDRTVNPLSLSGVVASILASIYETTLHPSGCYANIRHFKEHVRDLFPGHTFAIDERQRQLCLICNTSSRTVLRQKIPEGYIFQ